jgi:ketosteroid isomerase-like protein
MSATVAHTASQPSYRDIATRYTAAWNAHDIPAIMAMHAEDTTYRRHGSARIFRGKEAVAEQFGKDFSGLPGLKFEPISLHGSDDHFVAESIITATTPDGAPVTMELIDLIILRDGKVVSKDSYFVQSRPPREK